MIAGVALGAEPDHAVTVAIQREHLRLRLLEVFQDAVRRLHQHGAGRGERHALSQAQKERGPQSFLRVPQLVTERGLRQVQSFSRGGHAAFFRDSGQQLQMPDFQIHIHL